MKKMFSAFLVAVFMIATIGAASAAESPDAGSTWNTAQNFALSTGYNYINGGFTTSPVDETDWWVCDDPRSGDVVRVYISSASLNNNITVDSYCGNSSSNLTHMEHLEKNQGSYGNPTMFKNKYSMEVVAHSFIDWDYRLIVEWE